MKSFRWWLFKRLSAFGWWICPEPHKSHLQAVMPRWGDLAAKEEDAPVDNLRGKRG